MYYKKFIIVKYSIYTRLPNTIHNQTKQKNTLNITSQSLNIYFHLPLQILFAVCICTSKTGHISIALCCNTALTTQRLQYHSQAKFSNLKCHEMACIVTDVVESNQYTSTTLQCKYERNIKNRWYRFTYYLKIFCVFFTNCVIKQCQLVNIGIIRIILPRRHLVKILLRTVLE